MSTARDLNAVERLMLYRTWGKHCQWCKRPITYRSFEVDHLVPKNLTGAELASTLSDYGLPPSFDIYALPNLVPSCRPCNGSKGKRPVPNAPIIVTMLAKAGERASMISARASRFDRQSALDEVFGMLQAIQPDIEEMKALNNLAKVSRPIRLLPPCDPEPPQLQRSKHRLGYGGLSDKRQMFAMLETWVAHHEGDALEVVRDTFDGGDTPPKRVWTNRVNFLAYAKDIGDFLADVTFTVDYLYITDDYSDMAEAEHNVSLWITLDVAKRRIVDVVPDHLNTLHGCEGYV